MNAKCWSLIAVAIATVTGCSSAISKEQESSSPAPADAALAAEPRAIAVLTPTEGSQVTGAARFVQEGNQVKITVNVQGLEPNSIHAWHIHEYGNISGADGQATGGHYNPAEHPHAFPPKVNRHAGDLGNLKADANGVVDDEITVDNVTVNGEQNPIVGRGLIVHTESDDGGQPTGNAGDRLAQAVIGLDAEP
jgi:superoxide dismutase, Cu-Zn family